MKVLIIGAGQVGESIAGDLDNSHDVTVVEQSPDRAEELAFSYDVLTVTGDGTEAETLTEAGIESADMVIASTDNDETNIVACSTADALGDAFTIARIKQTKYLNTWELSSGAFGIDDMVCTNLLTAESIVRVVGLPAAVDVDPFAGGQVQMAEFEISDECPVADQTVQEADRYDSLTFAALIRAGDVIIPDGSTLIEAGDRVVVIGSSDSVTTFADALSPDHSTGSDEEVAIIGGSEIGYHLARLLGERGFKPRLIEQDPERARELAEGLPQTTVMESDATDIEFLEREHIGDADIVVAALESDEKNLLVSLLAERLGTDRTVAVIDTPAYVELFETVGIDVAINPRVVVAEEITQLTQSGVTENVALIETDKAEVIEIEVTEDSILANRTILESTADLPDGVVIGAITRDREFVTPRGDTEIHPGDHVVVFVDAAAIDETTKKL
ncbi:trk system potassium uptake protein TrkA [Halohasta litchfieldiae]|jgi:trk system potassium uptake protein TrkA|uniref:Trk system potassium uptake protein TrkA n=1 Tax=Halohasta litchfieldiae TaxID=1073996 RepID=A0A1H6UW47_9EURY|nr:Trk system potassium transporter TrkA [Halohasta litchfieldiae]ATW89429.1 trk system potassium uptake protein TrkA [Halohasta litchfieldiae]SEI92192.1 trk system potassium uptake protein TrkA [Halohasta litchfieldiae]